MKSVQINRYGSSEVVEINKDIPEGYFHQMIPLQFPSTMGTDISGIIKELGEGVSNSWLKQGDEVYGQASAVFSGGSGAFAELALTNKDIIAHKPTTLNHIEAAALTTVGVSAWQALVENIGRTGKQLEGAGKKIA